MQENRNYLAVLTSLHSFFYKLRIKKLVFLELHSIVETAKKHDKTPYNAIQTLFKVWQIDMHCIYWLPLNSYIRP